MRKPHTFLWVLAMLGMLAMNSFQAVRISRLTAELSQTRRDLDAAHQWQIREYSRLADRVSKDVQRSEMSKEVPTHFRKYLMRRLTE